MRHIHFFCGCVLYLAVFCQAQTVTLPSSSTVVEGASFRLNCTVTGGPDPSTPVLVTFQNGSTDVCLVNSADCSEIQSKPRFSCGAVSCGSGQTRVYFLDINPVSRQDDRDDWRCQYNAVLSTGSLTVNYSPSMKQSFPSIYTVIEKKRLNIDCSTYTTPGQPTATSYEWRHPDGFTTSVLDVSSISRSQRGQYKCTAVNTLSPGRQGKDNATVDVNVQYSPSITGIRDPYHVTENTNLQLDCSVFTQSNPAVISYIWSGPGDYSGIGPVLSITNINRNRSGQYMCTATNTLTPTGGPSVTGIGNSNITVDVQFKESATLPVSNSSTAAIVGGVVGGLVMVIIIVVVVILYRKGYECRSPIAKDRTQKNGQQVEEDNRAYATIGEPRESQANKTYSGLEHQTSQHYTGLTDETAPESSVSQRLQDKSPVTYEGMELHAYVSTSHEKKDPTYTNTTAQ